MNRNIILMRSRIFAALLSAAMLLTLLSGCGKDKDALTQILDEGQMVFGIAPDMEPLSFVPGEDVILANEGLFTVSETDAVISVTDAASGADVASNADKVSLSDLDELNADAEPLPEKISPADEQTEETEHFGMSIDIARALAARLNVEPVFVPVEQKDAVAALEQDIIDCYVGLAAVDVKTAATMNTVDTGIIYRQVFVVANAGEIKKISDLAGHKIGCVSNSDTAKALKKATVISGDAERIVYYGGADRMIAAVSNGDIDAAAVNEPLFIFRTFVRNSDDGGEETAGPELSEISTPLAEDDLVIAMRLRDESLSERIDVLYSDMISDGTVEQIKKKWMSTE